MIIYPSVINNISFNYAINPEFLTKHYQLKRVFDIWLCEDSINPNKGYTKVQFGPVIARPDTNPNSDRLLYDDILPEDIENILGFPL